MANDVASYISEARVLLQDQVAPYRYPDVDLVTALNQAVQEMARIRPDLFMVALRAGGTIPTYLASSQSTAVVVDLRYRSAVTYYMSGWAQIRDQEEAQDVRASGLLKMFTSQLVAVA